MIKKLDCKNLACPEPVLRTKEAWEKLDDNSILDIELNSISSIENVKRFARKEEIYFKIKSQTKELTVISLVKGYECMLDNKKEDRSFYSLIIGSIVSAILASTCCLAPLLFLLFGVSVGSLSFLKVFAPYHNYFSLFAIITILYLWYDYLKKKRLVCDTPLCKNYRLYLILGTVFVSILTTYPYWVTYLL